jgi:hypothetical protein
MLADETLRLSFGAGGNAAAFQRAGWGRPEKTFTWSTGSESTLELPAPIQARDLTLKIHAQPFLAPNLTSQTLSIDVNGTPIGTQSFRDEGMAWFDIPRATLTQGGKMNLRFLHPDATSPAAAGVSDDTRVLGFNFTSLELQQTPPAEPFRAAQLPPLPARDRASAAAAAKMCTGLDLVELAKRFESLGRNCEFGLVQRHFGAEPLGLLRYSSITPLNLLDALQNRFDGIDDPGNAEIYQIENDPSREWMIRDKRYRSESHSFRSECTESSSYVHKIARMRFRFTRRMLLETLACGGKICVFQHPAITGLPQIRPLAAALAALGPNMLLWASEDSTRPAGSVAVVHAGLMHGAIDYLAPEEAAGDGNLVAWTSLIANAYRLWREAGYGQGED